MKIKIKKLNNQKKKIVNLNTNLKIYKMSQQF